MAMHMADFKVLAPKLVQSTPVLKSKKNNPFSSKKRTKRKK